MARLGPGTWYHPKLGIPSAQIAARQVFLQKVGELARPAVISLYDEVFPAFHARLERRPLGGGAFVIGEGPFLPDARKDPAAPLWAWGAEENWGNEVHILAPRFGREAVEEGIALMERICDWCREWNLPPRPEEVLDQNGPRHAEIWVFNALGYAMSKWAERPELNPERTALFPYPFGSLHQILPRPPMDKFRPWFPTLEPWDVRDPQTRQRVGYFHEARWAMDLSHKEARRLLIPYKKDCEATLQKAGYRRVPEKRRSGAGRRLKGLEDEPRPQHDSLEHFSWLVRFQVLEESQQDILGPTDSEILLLHPDTVSSGIHQAAGLLPLTLRTS